MINRKEITKSKGLKKLKFLTKKISNQNLEKSNKIYYCPFTTYIIDSYTYKDTKVAFKGMYQSNNLYSLN